MTGCQLESQEWLWNFKDEFIPWKERYCFYYVSAVHSFVVNTKTSYPLEITDKNKIVLIILKDRPAVKTTKY